MPTHAGPFARLVRQRSFGAFTLTEKSFAPDVEVPLHTHSNAYLTFVLQGEYAEASATRTRACKQATLIVHPEGEAHGNRFYASGGRCFTVEFEPEWIQRLPDRVRALHDGAQLNDAVAATAAMRLHRELWHGDELSSIAVEGFALELLAILGRMERVPARQAWLSEARDVLHAHFCETITLADTAERIGVHPVHLARTFRQRYGCTVGEYVRNLRVQFACRRLVESSDPLAEIAFAVGFSHQSHFTTAFRRVTGLTPAKYRQQHVAASC